MRFTPLILAFCLVVTSGSESIGQYGNNSNSGNNNSRTRTQPRTKEESTDRESEDIDARDARRDDGPEDSINKGKPRGLSEGPETVGQIEEGNWAKLTPE